MKHIAQTFCAAALLAVGFCAPAALAQPANDDCANATPVVDGLNNVDNTDATMDTMIPCLFTLLGPSASGADVWYSYTAPATGIRNFEILNDANNPPQTTLAVYTSCGGTLLDCNVAGGVGGNAKIYHLAVTSGTTYLIRYSRYNVGASAAILNISAPPAPVAGDDCELATPFAGQGVLPFSTAGKTNSDLDATACDTIRKDGWIAWTPSLSGRAVISACDAANLGFARMSLYESCTEAPRLCNSAFLETNDPGNCINARLAYDVIAGNTYYIRYGSNRAIDDVSGNLTFEVRAPGPGITIPAGAIPEPGNCADAPANDLNGGCGVSPATFTHIELCQTRQGTVSARLLPVLPRIPSWSPSFDSDYYEFTLAQDDTITISGQSDFQATVRLTVNCPQFEIARAGAHAPRVNPLYDLGLNSTNSGPFTVFLVAGTYNFVITPVANTGAGVLTADCGRPGNSYWFRIVGSNPCPPACPADFNGANGVTVQDIFDFLAAWFSNSTTADFNGVNGVTVQDIFDFLAAWFVPCP